MVVDWCQLQTHLQSQLLLLPEPNNDQHLETILWSVSVQFTSARTAQNKIIFAADQILVILSLIFTISTTEEHRKFNHMSIKNGLRTSNTQVANKKWKISSLFAKSNRLTHKCVRYKEWTLNCDQIDMRDSCIFCINNKTTPTIAITPPPPPSPQQQNSKNHEDYHTTLHIPLSIHNHSMFQQFVYIA